MAIGLLAGYWALMALVPVPGFGAGRLDVEGNFAHYVDWIVLGAHNTTVQKRGIPRNCKYFARDRDRALRNLCAHLLRLKRTLAKRALA